MQIVVHLSPRKVAELNLAVQTRTYSCKPVCPHLPPPPPAYTDMHEFLFLPHCADMKQRGLILNEINLYGYKKNKKSQQWGPDDHAPYCRVVVVLVGGRVWHRGKGVSGTEGGGSGTGGGEVWYRERGSSTGGGRFGTGGGRFGTGGGGVWHRGVHQEMGGYIPKCGQMHT